VTDFDGVAVQSPLYDVGPVDPFACVTVLDPVLTQKLGGRPALP
jgi:hypothetical protein